MFDRKSYMKKYNKEYYADNKEREKKRSKKYVFNNIDLIKRKRKEWYKKYGKQYRLNHIKEYRKTAKEWARKNLKPYKWDKAHAEIQKRYRAKHKAKIAIKRKKYRSKRIKNDINYKLRWLLRSRIISGIKKQLGNKAYKTIDLLGCSIQKAREHIEKQFKDNMNWDNHGEWEIDHIIPISKFDLTNSAEQKKAFNYKNLQPLIKIENRKKSNRMIV